MKSKIQFRLWCITTLITYSQIRNIEKVMLWIKNRCPFWGPLSQNNDFRNNIRLSMLYIPKECTIINRIGMWVYFEQISKLISIFSITQKFINNCHKNTHNSDVLKVISNDFDLILIKYIPKYLNKIGHGAPPNRSNYGEMWRLIVHTRLQYRKEKKYWSIIILEKNNNNNVRLLSFKSQFQSNNI